MSTSNLTFGLNENFPPNIHHTESYSSTVSIKQLQQKLIQALCDANRREYSFEEIAIPTVPAGKIIFEFGLAEAGGFAFIDEEEVKKTLKVLSKERLGSMDFFCAIRYYRGDGEKRTPLKFDYYLLRTIYEKNVFEIQVFHERGPRYLSPEELTAFMESTVNQAANRKTLKKIEPNE